MAKQRAEKSPWYRSWLFTSALLLALVAAFLGGIIWAGRAGFEYLHGHERYDVPFADIKCDPPAGMDRREFLLEVRRDAKQSEQVNVLDESLPAQLQDVFAQHPWVEKVEAVQITPPKDISVKLTHRTAVLAVKIGANTHAVDGHGVLLPANAPTRDLKIYDGSAPPPKGPPGTRWGDPNVEAAARKLKK